MKAIINGRKYDTDTAKELEMYTYAGDGRFDSYDETLYVKKTGEYFLYGYGGPYTKYGVYHDGNGGFGEKIIPISEADAMEWAACHMNVDKYEEIFGEVEE